ncbi:MAG: hypothetical protein K0Q95_1952 [Bacteroidota bacterium]|jgi:hypothetical protein|nr:hypothetical protein [Bacteroidota bacterium]
MKKYISLERTGFATGLLITLTLIAYFFIMKALNLAQVVELRFFNFVFIAAGICYGINNLKHKLHEQEFYLKGLAQGMIITAVTVTSFALFMSIYLSYFDSALMNDISHRVPYTGSIDGMIIFVSIFMEGMASGAIITFSAMQYFKSEGRINTRHGLE